MDSISLDWEAAVADPRGAVELLMRVEEDAVDFLARVRLLRTKLEVLVERPWVFPGQRGPHPGDDEHDDAADCSPRSGPEPCEVSPQASSEEAQPAGSGLRVPYRLRVLEVTAADPEREWRLHEISEATGQSNQRSLRVLVEQLVGKGLLSKRTVKPRYVLYRAAPAHTEEAPTN
ncbi:hypothetical protein AB0469_26450 [Streptomyces sp. NPDC093801]|uniref:hypothetical protein n=1 Tax=Streptomyces sp. NPDC093801 TaxID=3155203 RepID=UPI00344FBC22